MTVTRAEQVQSRGNEGKRALSVPRPWATGASALRPMSGQRINCLGDLDWPRWEGPEQGSRNCVGGAAERTPPAARPASREAVASRIPSFGKRKGKSLGFRKNRSLEPTTLAQNLPLFDTVNSRHRSPVRYPERGRPARSSANAREDARDPEARRSDNGGDA